MKPRFERHVVGKPSKQGHGRMRMRIDKTRNQDVVGPLDEHAGLELGLCLRGWQDGGYSAVDNSHGMVFKYLT
jgi:hypothetical protein